jgi:hypothetical protein
MYHSTNNLYKLRFPYTAKNVIGNRLSRLKSASLFIKNTISSLGFIFATHIVLFYIIHV